MENKRVILSLPLTVTIQKLIQWSRVCQQTICVLFSVVSYKLRLNYDLYRIFTLFYGYTYIGFLRRMVMTCAKTTLGTSRYPFLQFHRLTPFSLPYTSMVYTYYPLLETIDLNTN